MSMVVPTVVSLLDCSFAGAERWRTTNQVLLQVQPGWWCRHSRRFGIMGGAPV
jgi:hypothetical protein